jgi:sugar/nucleoside kinase (ribokinase family)
MRKPYSIKIASISVVVLILAILTWSVLDASEDTGVRVTGNVLDCVGGRSKQCVIAILPSNEQVWVFNPGGKKADVVLLKKMKTPITKAVSYAIAF